VLALLLDGLLLRSVVGVALLVGLLGLADGVVELLVGLGETCVVVTCHECLLLSRLSPPVYGG